METYGTGNVPSNNTELIEVLKEAHDVHNIVLLNVTQCWKGTVADVYATGAILSSVGAVSGCVSAVGWSDTKPIHPFTTKTAHRPHFQVFYLKVCLKT